MTEAPISLRRNFAWTIAGNVVYGASQWAILSLIAKLGKAEMLGQYALALAIATPVAMLSHLNLRAVLATDMERRHPFHDYLGVRLWASGLTIAATAAIALLSGNSAEARAAIVLLGVALSAENVSDTYYGLMQRRERMDQIACSMMVRAAVSTAALGCVLWSTGSLVWAVAALAAGRIAVLLAYDRPRASAEPRGALLGRMHERAAILRTALPLGVALMLVSLTSNVPRYAIEHALGTRELGAFAAVASFLSAGGTVANALGQSATPRLARYFSEKNFVHFRGLVLRLLAVSVALGAAGLTGAAVAGRLILRIVYRPEYSQYAPLFVAVMGAGVVNYIAAILGFVTTSTRSFRPQMPLLAAVAASSALASWTLIPRIGLAGAACAIAVAALVQIAGSCWILRGAIRGARL